MSNSLQLGADTLLVIPCSGKKKRGHHPGRASTFLSALDPVRASALAEARAKLRHGARLDESALIPAYLRYDGQLYRSCSTSISRAVGTGSRIIIVSGGYGLLIADEPIGWYEKQFRLSDWPRNLLQECMLDYARRESIRSVISLMSATTDYAKLIRRVNWKGTGLKATLASPAADGGGAMVKVPRAQGEAIEALIEGGIDEDWRSSDSLKIEFECL